jgi:predicted nucleic acid-binding protein
MSLVLLNTDILSEFLRGNYVATKNVEKYLSENDSLNFSIITHYEILNGLLYKDAKNQLKSFLAFSEINRIIPFSINASKIAAEIYADLRKRGMPIGHTDCLIAGIALTNEMSLATNNIDHFSRINGLKIVNWLQ